jgi:hypothetical protein
LEAMHRIVASLHHELVPFAWRCLMGGCGEAHHAVLAVKLITAQIPNQACANRMMQHGGWDRVVGQEGAYYFIMRLDEVCSPPCLSTRSSIRSTSLLFACLLHVCLPFIALAASAVALLLPYLSCLMPSPACLPACPGSCVCWKWLPNSFNPPCPNHLLSSPCCLQYDFDTALPQALCKCPCFGLFRRVATPSYVTPLLPVPLHRTAGFTRSMHAWFTSLFRISRWSFGGK